MPLHCPRTLAAAPTEVRIRTLLGKDQGHDPPEVLEHTYNAAPSGSPAAAPPTRQQQLRAARQVLQPHTGKEVYNYFYNSKEHFCCGVEIQVGIKLNVRIITELDSQLQSLRKV
ncbi:hypothetical protein NDU88_002600 [Pleurodeles waltl]|uniref:Uncharacterized protein n=1 Tax=Pleurodeles waltl TaxID=8319 RepID=A0AAV7UDK5_PLEWA|nr:hypothetical protein NDU88_002600 [Pleurodeles waltl]